MNQRDPQQAELLDQYWTALATAPHATPPAGLDPTLAAAAQRLQQELRPPAPGPAFTADLRRRLDAEASRLPRRNSITVVGAGSGSALRLERPRMRWAFAGVAIAAVLLVAFIGDLSWSNRPQAAQQPSPSTPVPANDAAAPTSPPTSTPANSSFEQQLSELAKQADFPIFAPATPPANLTPRLPQLAPQSMLTLDYAPPEHVNSATPAEDVGLRITEELATYSLLTQRTENAEPQPINAFRTWLLRKSGLTSEFGPIATALVLRDGVLISVSSATISPDDLVMIAITMQPVSGSHAALPDPTPSTLDEVRQRVSFPVFMPEKAPANFTPEPPLGGDQPNENVSITYHTPDGAIALLVLNGPAGCCLAAKGAVIGENVTLANGITAHALSGTPASGGSILWWVQDGAYVALSGPTLSQSDLLTIAATMSKTAELGATEPAPARPSPAPLTTPGVSYLAPTWLPEPMTTRFEYLQFDGPSSSATGISLHFDAQDGANAQDALLLVEMPKNQAPNPATLAPTGVIKLIGGHEVTVGSSDSACINYQWIQGDIALTLYNSYNPDGQARYTCDEMEKIVASVQ